MQPTKLGKTSALFCLVFLFFILMAGLDHVVHNILYGFGLRFSFEWAVLYWNLFGCAFLVFGLVIGFAYWIGSGGSKQSLRAGIGLCLSVWLLFLGGLEDVIFYVVWGGGLPSGDVVWWWTPWYRIFGFWNSGMQLSLLSGVSVIACLFWILTARPRLLSSKEKLSGI